MKNIDQIIREATAEILRATADDIENGAAKSTVPEAKKTVAKAPAAKAAPAKGKAAAKTTAKPAAKAAGATLTVDTFDPDKKYTREELSAVTPNRALQTIANKVYGIPFGKTAKKDECIDLIIEAQSGGAAKAAPKKTAAKSKTSSKGQSRC